MEAWVLMNPPPDTHAAIIEKLEPGFYVLSIYYNWIDGKVCDYVETSIQRAKTTYLICSKHTFKSHNNPVWLKTTSRELDLKETAIQYFKDHPEEITCTSENG